MLIFPRFNSQRSAGDGGLLRKPRWASTQCPFCCQTFEVRGLTTERNVSLSPWFITPAGKHEGDEGGCLLINQVLPSWTLSSSHESDLGSTRQASAIILENIPERGEKETEGQPRLSKEGIWKREPESFCFTLDMTEEGKARADSRDPRGQSPSMQLFSSRGTGTKRAVSPTRSDLCSPRRRQVLTRYQQKVRARKHFPSSQVGSV